MVEVRWLELALDLLRDDRERVGTRIQPSAVVFTRSSSAGWATGSTEEAAASTALPPTKRDLTLSAKGVRRERVAETFGWVRECHSVPSPPTCLSFPI